MKVNKINYVQKRTIEIFILLINLTRAVISLTKIVFSRLMRADDTIKVVTIHEFRSLCFRYLECIK